MYISTTDISIQWLLHSPKHKVHLNNNKKFHNYLPCSVSGFLSLPPFLFFCHYLLLPPSLFFCLYLLLPPSLFFCLYLLLPPSLFFCLYLLLPPSLFFCLYLLLPPSLFFCLCLSFCAPAQHKLAPAEMWMMMMSWCLMSPDVIWHIRDKLWPMPKHGSIKATYVRCMRV